MVVILILILALSAPAAAAEPAAFVEIEPGCNTRFLGKSVPLSLTERTWLCGDPNSEVWQEIPPNQRIYFAKNFLEARGYHSPLFIVDQNKVDIVVGPRSRLRHLDIHGAPEALDWRRRRNIVNEPLTPDLLNAVESWAKSELTHTGFPCPKADTTADIATQSAILELDPGPSHLFGTVTAEKDANTIALLERYFAFRAHWLFDARLLELTSRRMMRDDLFLSSFFDWNCEGGYQLRQNLVTMKPRLFTVGVGADTEVGAFAQARWKHANLDDLASSFSVGLKGSLREQELELQLRKYVNRRSPFHIVGTGTVRRENERKYESVTYGGGAFPSMAAELPIGRSQLSIGPFLEYTKTIDGKGPRSRRTLHWIGKVDFMSHLYEYFLGDPQRGWTFSLGTDSRFKDKLADTTAHRLTLQGQVLYNIFGWEPPLMILGWRTRMGTFLVGNDRNQINEIPVSQRFFLGGDADIRGFSRKSLPADGRGFSTFFYNGLELRAGKLLPYEIQPLIFIDHVAAGIEPGALKGAAYWAPGAGIRYPSPIGVMRFTYARGFTNRSPGGDPERNHQLFFTLGQEL